MKLTVLGKYGPYPKAGGGTSSYIIESGHTRVNLDFGCGALSRTLAVTGALPESIVISHTHFDHTSDLLPLVYALKEPIKVYISFDDSPISEIVRSVPVFEAVEITDELKITVGELTFGFTRLVHPVESYGMSVTDGIKTFFYSGDTVFDAKVCALAQDSSFALLDASIPSDKSKGVPHMSLSDTRRIADLTKARVIATHVHPELDPTEEAKSLGVEIAEEMKTYEI